MAHNVLSLHCDICNVDVSSETVMQSHLAGKKHVALVKFKQSQQSLADRSIFVRGFPFGTTDAELKNVFSFFGNVIKVVISKEQGAYALIEYTEPACAKNALSSPSEISIGGRRVTIKPRLLKEVTKSKNSAQPLEEKNLGTRTTFKGKTSCDAHGENKVAECNQAAANDKDLESNRREDESLAGILKLCTSVEQQIEALVRHLELSDEDYAIRRRICCELQQLFDRDLAGLVHDVIDLEHCNWKFAHIVGGDLLFWNADRGLLLGGLESLWLVMIQLFPLRSGSTVQLFGSSANMLGVKGCDIDLFLDLTPVSAANDDEAATTSTCNVKKVARILRKAGYRQYSDIVAVAGARCPVVKLMHTPTKLHCDISINNRLALRNTELIRYYVTCDKRIRHLVYVVRCWAKMAGVSGSKGSKLTNYALTLLVIFYLQNLKPSGLPSVDELSRLADENCSIDGWDCSFNTNLEQLSRFCNNNTSCQTELLAGFFEFYSQFNFKTHAVCTRSGQAVDLQTFSNLSKIEPALTRFKISSMCIQDPFVLDHNTASNVNEKQSIYICSQFQLAASRCRLTDFTSFGGGADTSCQSPGLLLLMSSAPSIIEAPANNNEAVKQTSTGPVVQSVSVTFSLSKLATDSSCRQAGDLDAVRDAWCRDVASITRATLIEIMGMTCITRDCPSSTLLSHVTGGRSEAATQDCRVDRVKKQSESRDVQDVGVGKTTGVVNKRVLSYDSTTDGRVNVTGDETAVKRHKADDCLVGSDASELNPMRNYGDDVESQYVNDEQTVTSCESSNNISVVDDHKPLNIACDSQLLCADGMSQCCSAGSRNSGEHLPDVEYLFAADCSASCRLWSGRKKVRQQLTHYAHEYLREVEVTKMLKSKMPEPASSTQLPILTFEIVVVRRPVVAIDTVTIAMCPTRNTFAEFSCFVMYFKSLLVKLIERCVTGASCVR